MAKGVGGRKPTPRNILSLRGSRHAAIRDGEPEASGAPKKPDWLGPIASAKWDEMLPILERMKVTAEAFGDFLAQYCQAFEDFRMAQMEIDRGGIVSTSDKGNAYQNPAVGVKQNAIQRMHRFGCEFGLSPSSIRGVTKTEQQQKQPLASSTRKRG